jgi:predicted nucleic acid-binding protein
VSFLLDTCVLSELTRPRPDPHVAQWLQSTPDSEKFVSVISLGEVRFGILVARDALRRSRLSSWYEQVLAPSFDKRVIAFDEETADVWAAIRANTPNAPVIDAQIAATALAHELTLVTRNLKDFRFDGLSVLNPWKP